MRITAGILIWVACLIVALWSLLAMPISAIVGSGKRAWQVAVSYDQLGNATAGGDGDEVFSSRCWRMQERWHYAALMAVIDWIFLKLSGETSHCFNAYIKEQKKCQIQPPSGANNTYVRRKGRAKK